MLRVVSDPNFAPQSYYDQLIGRWRGFDVDVATEIARRLGVDVQFISGAFEDVQAGDWQPEWDLSVGSMTITPQWAERPRLHVAVLLRHRRGRGEPGSADVTSRISPGRRSA